MPPLVECLCRIALAAAMVDEFERNTQKTNKTQLLASNYGTFQALVVYEDFGTQHGPSTLHIDATCDKLRVKLKHHNWSRRACGQFQLSNVVRGQNVKKLLSDHNARQKSWRVCAPLVIKLLGPFKLMLSYHINSNGVISLFICYWPSPMTIDTILATIVASGREQ